MPLLVPRLTAEERGEAAAAGSSQLADRDTLFLVSTDFTHFGASYGYLPFTENIPAALEELDTGAILKVPGRRRPGALDYGPDTGHHHVRAGSGRPGPRNGPARGYEGALIDYSRSGDRDRDYSMSVSYASILLCTGPTEAASHRHVQ